MAKKKRRDTTSDGFRWNFARPVQASITKFYTLHEDKLPHQLAGYDVTSCFQSAVTGVRKIPHPSALFALNLLQCQRRFQISRPNNICRPNGFRPPIPYHRRPIAIALSVCRVVYCGQTVQDNQKSGCYEF